MFKSVVTAWGKVLIRIHIFHAVNHGLYANISL